MIVIWASCGHNPEIHDLNLQKYLKKKGFRIFDFTPYNKPKYKIFYNAVIGCLKYLFKYLSFSEIKFILSSQNVSLIRKVFYLSQLGMIRSVSNKNPSNINIVFRGNNIPLIECLHRYKNIKTMIIPHGLYFSDPPENNFFYYADSILTGTKTWPNKDYQGKKIYSGMIENKNLIKSKKKPGVSLDLSLCVTHGRTGEANEINRILKILNNHKFQTNIRFHPRNLELKNYIENEKVYRHELQKLEIAEYIKLFDIFLFTVGYNNRVSNVIYEAALCDKPVLIASDKDIKIVNIPSNLNKYIIKIQNLSRKESFLEKGNLLKDQLLQSIYQSDSIYNDIYLNLKGED